MTRRICVARVTKVACVGHSYVVQRGAEGGCCPWRVRPLPPNSFVGVWNISILARAVAGDPISNLSYIGVMRIRKQRLRTHVLGREDEGRVASPTEPS